MTGLPFVKIQALDGWGKFEGFAPLLSLFFKYGAYLLFKVAEG